MKNETNLCILEVFDSKSFFNKYAACIVQTKENIFISDDKHVKVIIFIQDSKFYKGTIFTSVRSQPVPKFLLETRSRPVIPPSCHRNVSCHRKCKQKINSMLKVQPLCCKDISQSWSLLKGIFLNGVPPPNRPTYKKNMLKTFILFSE